MTAESPKINKAAGFGGNDYAVRIECEIPVSYIERMFLRKAAEKNRETGIASANEICRQYRREGLFFDEIIDRVSLEADR